MHDIYHDSVGQAVYDSLIQRVVQRYFPFICLSPYRCTLCNLNGESVDHLFFNYPYLLNLRWHLLLEVKAYSVILKGCFKLLSSKPDALAKGKNTKTQWGCLVHAVIWNIQLEHNRRIFDQYKGVEVKELWDKVKFWASLWAYVSLVFQDVANPTLMTDLVALMK